jgi:DNA polymerase elongation subunit (family B)
MIGNFTATAVFTTAALSLPDDAIYHVLKQVKPSVQVFFDQQDIPEEDVSFPYLLVEKSASKTLSVEYGDIVAGVRDRYVSKECALILTYVGANAVENMSDYVEARDFVLDIMNKINVYLVLSDSVLNVSAVLDTTTEERSQAEGVVRYVETTTENMFDIGTVKVEAEVFDIDGDKVYDEEIEITV